MNQVFACGIALIIALVLWTSKKQSKISSFFKSQKDSLSKIPTSNSLVINKNLKNPKAARVNNKKSKRDSNQNLITSVEIKKKLIKLISSNPKDRLLAIKIATEWGNKKALPFLIRGLKDSDSRVVIASASAISAYKGKTIAAKKSQISRPPRNVFLMR